MKNPYQPGTLKYKLLDGDWSKMTPTEISKAIGYRPSAVRSALHQIHDETGIRVPHINGKSRWCPPPKSMPRPAGRPDNPFPPGRLSWYLFEYDWSELTIPQIAETLDVDLDLIGPTIRRIRKRTGADVQFRRRGRWSKQQPSSGENPM